MPSKNILLIEDDESAQYIFATALRHAGYSVSPARTAAEGLRLLSETPPDAVLVDIGLPDVDGFEFIRRMRALPVGQTIPVIVVTVYAFESDRETAMAAGCDAFLKKPLSPLLLIETLDRLIDGFADDGGVIIPVPG